MEKFFSDKKSRFSKKIFTNKIGPIFHEDKSLKNIINKNIEKNVLIMEIKGGLYNKPIKGYSFGTSEGKLNLIKKRKELRNQRSLNYYDNMEKYNNISLIHKSPLKQSKDEKYFENALKKKNSYKQNIIEERHMKMNKILAIHNENLKKIEEEKKIKILQKSLSVPNLLLNSASFLDESSKEKEKILKKQRYHDAIYGKNQIYLEKYNKQLSKIRIMSSHRIEPAPYLINIRTDLLNPHKGVKIHEEFKTLNKRKYTINFPQYKIIKDDFDRIVENGKKKLNFLTSQKTIKMNEQEMIKKQRREEKLNLKEKENLNNLEALEEKRNKWIAQREENNLIKRKKMQNTSLEKMLKHQQLLNEEEDKKKIISDLRRDISIQKGYGDPYAINPINYSQVEESSPRYSMKGRYIIRQSRDDDINNLVLGSNIEYLNQIKLIQKNQPLPNYNYIKPKLPSIVFNKAERFPKSKPSSDEAMSIPLFDDGIFKPSDHKDFLCKEPMSELSKRGNIGSSPSKSPSPADIKMKSSFDEIAEKGLKINTIRTKIKKENDLKLKEKEKEKSKEKKKKQNSFDKNISLNLSE